VAPKNHNMDETNDERKDIEEFDIEAANNLLRSIRVLSDLKKLQVPDPASDNMGSCELQQWMKWFFQQLDSIGSTGLETMAVGMIDRIAVFNGVQVMKVEEGFRRLLTVVDRRQKRIDILENVVARQKEVISDLNDENTELQLNRRAGLSSPKLSIEDKDESNDEVEGEDESNDEEEPEEKKKLEFDQPPNRKPKSKKGLMPVRGNEDMPE